MKAALSWLMLLALPGCVAGNIGSSPAVQAAGPNYPPMIITGNVHSTDGHEPPRSCAGPGARVDGKGGPVLAFGGADASDPDLCAMTIDGQPLKAWYDIWLTDWPGAAQAHSAIHQLFNSPSGTVVGFDTKVGPGREYHDLLRNEGIEDILVLNTVYRAAKISHYREGIGDNNYRSVATVWKDIPTGTLLFSTYQHISGQPVIDDPLIPVAITPR